MKAKYDPETARCVRTGFWDERVICSTGYRIYAFGFFTRRILRLIHGAETRLPKKWLTNDS